MRNKDVADILDRMGTLLEIQGENVFKVRAYHKAAENIENLSEDIETIKDEGGLTDISGVGKELAEKITQYLEKGKIDAYEKLIKDVPETLLDVVEIPSVGPKKAKLFFEELKVKTVKDLKKKAEAGKLQDLPKIRQKTVEKILKGIKQVESGHERMNLGLATKAAEKIVDELKRIKEIKQMEVAGSLRRGKETVRDIDILVDSSDPKKVMDAFVRLPQVKNVQAHGETKSSVVTDDNVQIDLRVVEKKSFGAALLYFTGSKSFNIKLRQIAQKKKMKVNEYGIFKVKGKKEEAVARKTEKECLEALGLKYIPPELREEIGEERIFDGKKIPKLIEQKDIRGELHVHSTYSDGKNSIGEMAKKAKDLGYSYLAVSDHSQGLRVANGVTPQQLKKKKKEIDDLNKKMKGFRVLFGSEVEIDSDGNLDYNDKILSDFDIVIAAVHSGFEQDSKKLTQRILKAIKNKHVNIIAHPTGVHLGKRAPYNVDLEEIYKAAADHNVFLEINAFPVRLDLNSVNVYNAAKKGVKFCINTDSHRTEHMDHMRFGISIARRGWLRKGDVLNTRSVTELLKMIKK